MKWNAARAVSAMFALVLTAVLAGQAYASCGKSQRIDHDDADCLDAGWDNSTNWLSHGKVWARNECPEHGTVVAKVDIKGGKDKTWHLSDGDKKSEGTSILNTRNVSCCSDLSDLCDTSEISADSCLDRFRDSSANTTCQDMSASVNGNRQCVFNGECERVTLVSGTTSATLYELTSITVSWGEVEDLDNCYGVLTVGRC